MISQLLAASFAAILFGLIVSGQATLVVLAVTSFAFGILVTIEVPVRQAYMTALVPREDNPSAASLHATAWIVTRLFGPVLAGVIVATLGPASPFLFGTIVRLFVAASVLSMHH